MMEWQCQWTRGRHRYIIHLDFWKVFKAVPHNILLSHQSRLGPVSPNTLISNIDEGTEFILSKIVDDIMLNGAVDTHEGWNIIQRDPDKFKKWAQGNLTWFNKTKWKVLHLSQGSISRGWGMNRLRNSPAENDLRVLVDDSSYLKSLYKHTNMSDENAFSFPTNIPLREGELCIQISSQRLIFLLTTYLTSLKSSKTEVLHPLLPL